MRGAFLLVLAGCGGAAAKPAPMPADPPAVHGMLLFGERALYLSHLPLFHSPHDYQVILAASVDEAARSRYLADRAASGSIVYTFVPERFRLPEVALAPAPRSFSGAVVRGHFERGGTEIESGVAVAPRVIFSRRFAAGATADDGYLLFGTRDEAYAAHLIHAPPDFDQVVAVRAPEGVTDAELRAGVELHAGAAGSPLAAGTEVNATLPGGRKARLAVVRQIYLEQGELAE